MQTRTSLLGSAAFAALWALLAFRSATTTFHLAPVIVAAWPAVTQRNRATALSLVAAGLAIASSAAGLLAAGGLLLGPSLIPFGGPLVESLAGATLGALVGMVISWSPVPQPTPQV